MFRPASLFALTAAFVTSALAQNTPPPPNVPAVPAVPTVQVLPGATPALPGQRTMKMDLPMSTDVKDVLRLYEDLTGRRILHDNQMQGPVPIRVKGDVSYEEAIRIMEIALLMNGYSLVPTDDPKIWKAISQSKNPRTGAVPLFTDVDMLPDIEQVVTMLFKLNFADPQELATTLQQAFPPSPAMQAAGQTMVPLPKASALLVTENTPNIRQIARIIREVDLPPAEVVSRFFPLLRADAKDVQEKLENILTKQQPGATTTPGGGGAVPRPQVVRVQTMPDGTPLPANVPAADAASTVEISIGPNEENFVAGKVKITADVRTNRLHVIAREKAMREIARLIEQFDANIPFGVPEVRPLRFVSAADIFQVLVKAVSEPGQEGGAGGAAGGGSGSRPRTSGQSGSGLTGALGSNSNRGGAFGGDGSGSGSGGQTFSESLSAEERDVVPDAVTIGNTRIIADKRANAIIVVGNRDVREKIFKVIDKLDVRAPQVMLHTCIGQLTLSNNEEFSVDYILNKGGRVGTGAINAGTGTGTGTGNGGTGNGGNGTGNGNGNAGNGNTGVIGFNGNSPTLNLGALLNQRNIRQIATVGGTGLTGFFTAGNAFNAIVTALESTSRFRVTSRPSVFASNNKKAVISSGQEIAIPTNSQSGFGNVGNNNAFTSTSIQFKTVALTLEILPLINSENEVTLDIVQKIQEQVATDIIDGNPIPRIATRDLKTTVSIPNEATLVLGGLIRQSNTKTRSGIPYLSRIPYIGGLFGSTTSNKVRDELVILIRPVVTNFPTDAIRVREREMQDYNLDQDLESTITPPGVRQRVPAEQVHLRVPTPPKLREYQPAPTFK